MTPPGWPSGPNRGDFEPTAAVPYVGRTMFQLQIPIWREARVAYERAALSRDPVLRGQGVPRGDGRPVLLVPGFMAGDLSLGLMGRWLRQIGYAPCRAGIRAN